MSLQEAASQVGRRATKFCPANVQKIKDWVAARNLAETKLRDAP